METGITLSIVVSNKFGVLCRVAGLFSKRGYNIDSLHVNPLAEDDNFSRIILTSHCTEYTKEQMIKQISKLYDVKEVKLI